MKPYSKTLTIDGVSLDILYTIHGKYRPATKTDPAEYPELEVFTVTTNENIRDILSENILGDIEYRLLHETT